VGRTDLKSRGVESSVEIAGSDGRLVLVFPAHPAADDWDPYHLEAIVTVETRGNPDRGEFRARVRGGFFFPPVLRAFAAQLDVLLTKLSGDLTLGSDPHGLECRIALQAGKGGVSGVVSSSLDARAERRGSSTVAFAVPRTPAVVARCIRDIRTRAEGDRSCGGHADRPAAGQPLSIRSGRRPGVACPLHCPHPLAASEGTPPDGTAPECATSEAPGRRASSGGWSTARYSTAGEVAS
jgi:hypothetical protein